jgi:hypothetical protein
LKSTIINMADRMKDAQDLKLESLFASDSIPDGGFSVRIEKRVRRQIWVRRLTLPIAVLIGGAIAIKPLAGLVTALVKLLSVLPASIRSNLEGITIANLPQLSTFLVGGALVVAAITLTRLLED